LETSNSFPVSSWKKLTIRVADTETKIYGEMTTMSASLYCIRVPATDDCINLIVSDDFGASKMVQIVFSTTRRFNVGTRCILTQENLICF